MPVPYFNPQQFRLQELPVILISTVVVNGRIGATPILVNITCVLPSKMDASKNMDSVTLKVSYNFGVYTIEHANPVLVGLWMISYS